MGPRCTVRTDEGLIVHGYRVPDDYQGATLYVGACVRCEVYSSDYSALVEDRHGRPQVMSHEDGKLLTRPRAHDYPLRTVVKLEEPPPLLAPIEPGPPQGPHDHSRIRWN